VITNNVEEGYSRFTYIYTHSVESVNRNYNELGFAPGNQSSPSGEVTSRIVLPSSVTVLDGQQLRVTMRFTAYASPITPEPVSLVVSGWDTGTVTQQLLGLITAFEGGNAVLNPMSGSPGQGIQMHTRS